MGDIGDSAEGEAQRVLLDLPLESYYHGKGAADTWQWALLEPAPLHDEADVYVGAERVGDKRGRPQQGRNARASGPMSKRK